jgi:hypothetical protein
MHAVALNWENVERGHSLLQCELLCRPRRPESGQRSALLFRPARRRHPQRGSESLQVVRAQGRHADWKCGRRSSTLPITRALGSQIRPWEIRFSGPLPATPRGKHGSALHSSLIFRRTRSFLHPEEKLKAIRDVAEAAHHAGNYAFVYIAGTECITAHGDQVAHTLAKDHPDWLQRKITGEPAIFGGGTAFWIRAGDEDVWVSPYAPEWRKTYMERVRQIAGLGSTASTSISLTG